MLIISHESKPSFHGKGRVMLKTTEAHTSTPHEQPPTIENCWMRWTLLVFGWANIGLGIVGIFLPGLPTTVFLLIALWAFSKSSLRFHTWLWNHPRFGPPVRDWHNHQVIPLKAKLLAVMMMSVSLIYIAAFVAKDWQLPLFMVLILSPIGIYIVTRASSPPEQKVPARVDVDGV